jgi:hypothetical protein
MFMEKRENLVHKFSSFICFTGNNHRIQLTWKVDLNLENHMKSKVEADADAKEIFWVQYFIKLLLCQEQSDNKNILKLDPKCSFTTAKQHLSAYLQEACFKAAKDIHKEFNYIRHKYSLEEFFQIANIAASSPLKVLKNFNFERNKINIEAYTKTTFKRFIRNHLYQQDLEARRTKFSNFGLLKDLSAGELTEAFVAQNFSNRQIILYRLAWECFNEIFQPTPNRLNRALTPSPSDFTAIATYYNQRCNQLNLPHVPVSDITIQEMLSTCINTARNYRAKQYSSLELKYQSISDPAPPIWDILIQQEEWQQVQVIVDKLFTAMPEVCQIIFQLWQGLNLTQTEMANILKSKYPELQKQYQVARHLKRYTRSILREFAWEWNKINSGIYLNHEQDMESIKSALEQCLQLYCRKMFFSTLDIIFQSMNKKEQINMFYHIKSADNLIFQQKGYDLEQQLDSETAIKFKLIELFQQELEKTMCLEVNSLKVVHDKIVDVINEWIKLKQDNFYDEK